MTLILYDCIMNKRTFDNPSLRQCKRKVWVAVVNKPSFYCFASKMGSLPRTVIRNAKLSLYNSRVHAGLNNIRRIYEKLFYIFFSFNPPSKIICKSSTHNGAWKWTHLCGKAIKRRFVYYRVSNLPFVLPQRWVGEQL